MGWTRKSDSSHNDYDFVTLARCLEFQLRKKVDLEPKSETETKAPMTSLLLILDCMHPGQNQRVPCNFE
jgi:hypothetical protein